MGDEAEVVSDWNDDTAFFDSWSDGCGNFMHKEYHEAMKEKIEEYEEKE